MFSTGYWFDRLWRKWIKVEDHARAVVGDPKKFRLSKEELFRAVVQDQPNEFRWQGENAILLSEDDRASVIIRATQAGFIRVRDTTGHLGWQFAGDPIDGLALLRRYMKRKGIGDATEVTFTDFGLGTSVTDLAGMFRKDPPGDEIQKLIEKWVARYERKP